MSTKFILIIFITLGTYSLQIEAQNPKNLNIANTKMVLIESGYYTPLFRQNGNSEKEFVQSFYIDIHAVTNEQFLQFIKANTEWTRSKVKKIFADDSYLKDWKSDFNPGENVNPSAPVTYVSWFAAKAYSKWVGKRLPTMAEWELVAMAGKNNRGPNKDEKFNENLIRWYLAELPKQLDKVMSDEKNYWGVYDMFGLIREWTFDFNTANINGTAICGGGSAGATDLTNYPAFLRYGFNSCLSANSDLGNLGFRCAKDAK